MPRVVIHAGLPKTATSFLQAQVFPLIDSAECVFNPDRLTRMLIELSKQVQSGCEVDEDQLDRLEAEVGRELEAINAPVVLISVEGLMPLHVGGYENTQKILSVVKRLYPDADVVVFLREQMSWFRSAYSFCLVSKYVLPFDDFVCREGPNKFGDRSCSGLGVNVMDYEWHKVRQLVNQFYASVRFFRFEDLLSEDRERVLSELAVILGVAQLTVGSSDHVNKGLDEALMVKISKIARLMPFRAHWHAKYLYTRYSNLGAMDRIKYFYLRKSGQLAVLIAKILYKLSGGGDQKLFSEDELNRVRSHYRSSNAAFWEAEG